LCLACRRAEFLVVLNADGSLTSFGGIGVAPTGRFIAISGGFAHAAAITENRRVVAWGLNHQGQTDVPSGLPVAARVAVTYNNTAIIDIGGQIHVWGWGAEGLTAPPSGAFADMDGGEFHFAARRTNGLVACWGFNSRGQTDVPTNLGPCLSAAAGGGIVGSFALVTRLRLLSPARFDVGETMTKGSVRCRRSRGPRSLLLQA
jgi:alpha-tubulin suppressor-like RCC1 family protein